MSRIGKKIISIPQGVTVSLDKGMITVKGPKKKKKKDFNIDLIRINIADDTITSEPIRNDKFSNAIWGTYMSHIENMIAGSEKSFEKKLIIEGVGFKWEVKADKLQLNVGFSHPVFVDIPADLTITAEKGNLTITGIDKESVSRFAMQVRKIKKGEAYEGRGVGYVDEVLRRKQGKKYA